MHLIQQWKQALTQRCEAVFDMRRYGLEVFARDKARRLQLGQLARQRSMRDASEVSLKLVEPAVPLRKPVDDQQLPST